MGYNKHSRRSNIEETINNYAHYTNKLDELINKTTNSVMENLELLSYKLEPIPIIRLEDILHDVALIFTSTKKSEYKDFEELQNYFKSSLQHIKSNIQSQKNKNVSIIFPITFKINTRQLKGKEADYFAIFISAFIQATYDELGLQYFEFEEINANFFGALLQAKENKKIWIEAKKIIGHNTLCFANHIYLTVSELNGHHTLYVAQNSTLNAVTLKGDNAFCYARDCTANIEKYKGENFGIGMKYCQITSTNKKILKKIEKQAEKETNTFETKS
ncbi:hypothetical protein HY643_04395 [Candidatus Woesearchaeota archaeon]|nr:hypothetical protein [Candidatus Woesearchaeota archaeon]